MKITLTKSERSTFRDFEASQDAAHKWELRNPGDHVVTGTNQEEHGENYFLSVYDDEQGGFRGWIVLN